MSGLLSSSQVRSLVGSLHFFCQSCHSHAHACAAPAHSFPPVIHGPSYLRCMPLPLAQPGVMSRASACARFYHLWVDSIACLPFRTSRPVATPIHSNHSVGATDLWCDSCTAHPVRCSGVQQVKLARRAWFLPGMCIVSCVGAAVLAVMTFARRPWHGARVMPRPLSTLVAKSIMIF
jgi:hypothetical protein